MATEVAPSPPLPIGVRIFPLLPKVGSSCPATAEISAGVCKSGDSFVAPGNDPEACEFASQSVPRASTTTTPNDRQARFKWIPLAERRKNARGCAQNDRWWLFARCLGLSSNMILLLASLIY